MNLVTEYNSHDYATSIKIDVMNRILKVLCDSGPKKITNLAMLSGLNHITCRKYSNLLKILTWVDITQEEKSIIISVTEEGKKIREILKTVY